MPHSLQAGDRLAQRYRLDDLLTETPHGRFWRGWDTALSRPVAIHLMARDAPGSTRMIEAARGSAGLPDRRVLRVLDAADTDGGIVYVVNEWGQGASLDVTLAAEGPLEPRRAAHLVAEVADTLAATHDAGLAHGRLTPESVLVDRNGQVRIIGFAIDAAAHGLPPGRMHADVVDLAGLLYAALTGRWAGMSASDVAPAPLEGGVLMRPRQVRAGIPRVLDGICDLVLNPYPTSHYRPTHDLSSARGLADELAAFVGDATGLLPAAGPPQAPYATGPAPVGRPTPSSPPPETTVLPPAAAATTSEGGDGVKDEEPTRVVPVGDPVGDPVDGAGTEEDTDASPDSTDTDESAAPEQPTQAGLPVWDDDSDDVSWVTTQRSAPPPPPPLEPIPERPLFAPEPPEGAPPRRSRRPVPTPAPAAAQPWENDPHWDGGSSSGSGSLPAYDESVEDEVPGRSWLRLAMIVGMCALVMVAAVAAWDLGGGGDLPNDPEADSDTTQAAAPVVYEQLTASDLDPQGDPPEENPESVALAVDGDEATAWNTSTYNDQLGPPPGLKTGVGLVVDLGRVRDVSQVEVSVLGGSTSVSLYVTEQQPTTVDGLDPADEKAGEGTIRMPLSTPATGRYVVVWLTALPAVDGGFRGEVAEVRVAG